MSFADQLTAWHDFFATVAALAATLLGLLFVSLGLNPEIMAADGPSGMRVLAAQTFHNFLMLLVLALVALIPDDTARALAFILLFIGGLGVIRLALDLRRARADPDPRWSALQSLTRYASPGAAYLICLYLAYDLHDGNSDVLGWIVAIVFFLLMSAAANCWDLLEAIGRQSKQAHHQA